MIKNHVGKSFHSAHIDFPKPVISVAFLGLPLGVCGLTFS